MMITKNLGLLFIIISIIFSTGIQNANADIFDDMADLVKKEGTSIVCITVITLGSLILNAKGAYPQGACDGL